MKTKTNLILLSLLIALISCNMHRNAETDSFIIKGKIKGLSTDFMSLSYRGEDGSRIFDTIFVNDDSFKYSAKIKEPNWFRVWMNIDRIKKSVESGGYIPVRSNHLEFLASPGDVIEFKGEITDFVNAYPYGTKTNSDLAEINSKTFPILNRVGDLVLKKIKSEKGSQQYKVLADSIEMLNKTVNDLKIAFIELHPASEAAAWYLSDMMTREEVSFDEALDLYNHLDPVLNDYRFYKEVKSRIDGIESTKVGETVPNFTTGRTLDGSEFRFSDLRGKYVLIDFWGTWCNPCIKEMPRVKEYKDKYKGKLVVIGVNKGDGKKEIVKFIEKRGFDWFQIMSGEKADQENIVLMFGVAGYPTKILIDPQGKVIYREVGGGDEAFNMLDSLLN